MFQFFKSAFFQFEFLRILAMTPFEGGEINEILITASRITDQDPESWFENWSQVGCTAEKIAHEAERSGDRAAARRAYLRASNYFRAAQFMLNEGPVGHDARVLPTLERAIADFRRGVSLLDGDVFFLDIPYEGGVSLPGYLYLPPAGKRLPGPGRGTPVLVNAGGGDSTQEEIYFINASAGPGLGYAVLTFDGPGQGAVLRRHALPMRPDFEAVVARVLDHLWDLAARHPEAGLDLDRVAIAGASMGGYFSLRGATDRRVRACVCVDGFHSMESFARGRVPAWLWALFRAGRLRDGLFDAATALLARCAFQTRWEFNHMRWAMGAASDAAVVRRMLDFSMLRPDGTDLLRDVRCPVLVTGAGSSFYFDPETTTRRILRGLAHLPEEDREEWIETDEMLGGMQAKIGAFGYAMQRTFAFLDDKFGIEREPLTNRLMGGP